MISDSIACLNCGNLQNNSICNKHHKSVHLDNICDDHNYKKSLTNDSSCTNCLNFKTKKCPNPSFASNEMLCFSWTQNQILSH